MYTEVYFDEKCLMTNPATKKWIIFYLTCLISQKISLHLLSYHLQTNQNGIWGTALCQSICIWLKRYGSSVMEHWCNYRVWNSKLGTLIKMPILEWTLSWQRSSSLVQSLRWYDVHYQMIMLWHQMHVQSCGQSLQSLDCHNGRDGQHPPETAEQWPKRPPGYAQLVF